MGELVLLAPANPPPPWPSKESLGKNQTWWVFLKKKNMVLFLFPEFSFGIPSWTRNKHLQKSSSKSLLRTTHSQPASHWNQATKWRVLSMGYMCLCAGGANVLASVWCVHTDMFAINHCASNETTVSQTHQSLLLCGRLQLKGLKIWARKKAADGLKKIEK